MSSDTKKEQGGNLQKFDEGKTYFIKGSTLRRLCKAANEWTSLVVQWGPASGAPTLAKGEAKSILTIPQWSGGGAAARLAWALHYDSARRRYSIGQAKIITNLLDGSGPAVTGLTGIQLSSTTKVWLKGSFDEVGNPTTWEVTTVDPTGDRITWAVTTPFYQKSAYYLLGQVLEGANSALPGFDFAINNAKYHYEQLAFTALLAQPGVANGKFAWYPIAL